MIGYMVFLKDGHHHQLVKVRRIKYKKKKQEKKDKMRRTRRISPSRVLSSTPSPTGGTKTKAPPVLSKRRAMTRWLLTRLGRWIGVGTAPFGCPRKSYQHEGASNGVGSKGDLKPKNGFGEFGDFANKMM